MVTINEVVSAIKSKKELSTLDDNFVRKKVEKILDGNAKIVRKMESSKDFEQFSRSQEFKGMMKHVRKELRTVYGVFQEGDRNELLKKLTVDNIEVVSEILETHTSTRERIPYYDQIYKELSDRIPKPKKIIDLGCGLNPLSHVFMRKHGWNPEWFASDISQTDMEFLSECFSVLNITGTVMALDLTKDYDKLANLEGNITFVLKLLDSLEETERHISYKIFENIKTKWIVVSFPTKSLGGNKNISTRGRLWFERLLNRFELKHDTFQVENELFYVIER